MSMTLLYELNQTKMNVAMNNVNSTITEHGWTHSARREKTEDLKPIYAENSLMFLMYSTYMQTKQSCKAYFLSWNLLARWPKTFLTNEKSCILSKNSQTNYRLAAGRVDCRFGFATVLLLCQRMPCRNFSMLEWKLQNGCWRGFSRVQYVFAGDSTTSAIEIRVSWDSGPISLWPLAAMDQISPQNCTVLRHMYPLV